MARAETGGKRHPDKALSAVFVRQVVEPGKYSDGNGLFLLVQPNGSKSWVQRITIRGRRTDIGLGGATFVSLADAREVALTNKKLARAGGDPLQAKREAQAVLTFADAARKVHEMHKPTWRNEKHAAQFIKTLETYAFPQDGNAQGGRGDNGGCVGGVATDLAGKTRNCAAGAAAHRNRDEMGGCARLAARQPGGKHRAGFAQARKHKSASQGASLCGGGKLHCSIAGVERMACNKAGAGISHSDRRPLWRSARGALEGNRISRWGDCYIRYIRYMDNSGKPHEDEKAASRAAFRPRFGNPTRGRGVAWRIRVGVSVYARQAAF